MLRFLAGSLRSGPGGRFTAADLIERTASRRGEQAFVRFEGRSASYREYHEAADRVAHWALGRGLGRGDVVALMMENRPEYLLVWAGLAKAGATAALINTHLTGTFKLRKVDLQREGFDPSTIDDPLLYRDDAHQIYAPLDTETHERIRAGAIRF